jgi:hypothetical protein
MESNERLSELAGIVSGAMAGCQSMDVDQGAAEVVAALVAAGAVGVGMPANFVSGHGIEPVCHFATERVSMERARALIFGIDYPELEAEPWVELVRPRFGPPFLTDEMAHMRNQRKSINFMASAAYGTPFEKGYTHPILGPVVFLLTREAQKGWTWEPEEADDGA